MVVNNLTVPRPPEHSGEVHGKLVLYQSTPERTTLLTDQRVTLPPGKKVFSVRQQIDAPNFYTYEARFIPDRPEDDTMPQNNRATAFTQVQGKGQVLLIEDCEHRGEHDAVGRAAAGAGLAGDRPLQRPGVPKPGRVAALRRGGAGQRPRDHENVHFTDDQIEMLVRNTQQMGAGLVMLGGPNSFGAGGWTGTRIGKGHAGRFPDPERQGRAPRHLVMLMHASEIPEGNHWQKVIAKEAIKTLGGRITAASFTGSGAEQWLWNPTFAGWATTATRCWP